MIYLFTLLSPFFTNDAFFMHNTSPTKDTNAKNKIHDETVSIENETVKDGMTNIISIPEDSSSNTTESANEMKLHDKSFCTDLSTLHHIVTNRTNNENNSFDENSIKSTKDCTEK